MRVDLEQDLRLLFAEDAESSPELGQLARRARRSVRRRRGAGASSIVLAALVVSGSVLIGQGDPPNQESSNNQIAVPTPPQLAGKPGSPVPSMEGASGSCVRYSPKFAMTSSAQAFDGTVITIGPPHERRGFSNVVTVSLVVNEWFKGRHSAVVTIDIPQGGSIDPGPPAISVGTRLLVTSYRHGRVPGQTPTLNIAAGCRFTRYYSPSVADRWRRAGEWRQSVRGSQAWMNES